jgi:hypothetical protein
MNRHLSPDEISGWMIGERSPEARSHALECPACRAELDRLQDAFLRFRESGVRWSERYYSGTDHRLSWSVSPLPAIRLLPWAGAVAASLFVGSLLLLGPAPVPRQSSVPERPVEEPFLEIPYVAPLAPYERAAITRMDVPVAALVAAGFEVHVADAGATVRADVLFGQDGRAHAIRLVRDSPIGSNRFQ